jgi:K+:H+ antiporter
MDEFRLLLDLVVAVLAAFVGGALAQRIGLPVVVGYLAAGLAVGPFTPGFAVDQRSISVLADIGVAFLMFAVGSEFSRSELRRLGRVAGLGGVLQILGTMALGLALAPLLGASAAQGVYLGALIALSSTVVALKVLMARGELESLHGRVTLGLLVVQDLAVIPMMVILPAAVGGSGSGDPLRLLVTAGEAVALVLGTYLIGVRLVPWVLGRVAVARTRELFLLGVVGLTLGTALAAQAIGLSLAFGAFLAGLVVAESEFRTQVVAEVLPLRDLFIALFFVSVGMLINPVLLVQHASLVGLMTAVVVVGKLLVAAAAVLVVGMPARVAILAGLSLAQVGEFSFVLARVGVNSGAIPELFLELVLATALTSVVLAPFTPRAAPALLGGLRRLPGLGRRLLEPDGTEAEPATLRRHAVVCGYGRVGRELVDLLARRSIPCLVIEYNPESVRQLRARQVPVIYGDASNPGVLHHARLEDARLLAVLTADPTDTEQIVRLARATNPRLDIVARARDAEQMARLQRLGVSEVVQPEFEAGLEVIRHALQRFGVSGTELGVVAQGRRRAFYERGLRET